MLSRHIRRVKLGGSLIVSADLASAQTAAAPPTLRVSDQATVTVRPDEARSHLGVDTAAESAERAARQNPARAREVVHALEAPAGRHGRHDQLRGHRSTVRLATGATRRSPDAQGGSAP